MMKEEAKKSAVKKSSADETVYIVKVNYDERHMVGKVKSCIKDNVLRNINSFDKTSGK